MHPNRRKRTLVIESTVFIETRHQHHIKPRKIAGLQIVSDVLVDKKTGGIVETAIDDVQNHV